MEASSHASASVGEAGTSEEAAGEAAVAGDSAREEPANSAAQEATVSTGLPSPESLGQQEAHLTSETAEVVTAENGTDAHTPGSLVDPQQPPSEPAEITANGNANSDDKEAAAVRHIPDREIEVAAGESPVQPPPGAAEKAEPRPADTCEADVAVTGSVATQNPVHEVQDSDLPGVKAAAAPSAEAAAIREDAEVANEQPRPVAVEAPAAVQAEAETESPASTSVAAEQAVAENLPGSSMERRASGDAQADPAVKAAEAAPQSTRATSQVFIEKLRHPSAAAVVGKVRDFVGAFPANLTRPQASRRIHEFISSSTPELLMAEVFVADADEGQTHFVMEGLEKFVVLKLYKLLFRHSAADIREDERVDGHIRERESGGSEGGGAMKVLEGLTPEQLADFNTAAQELKKVDQYRSPRDKAVCMVNAFRFVEGVADAAASVLARSLLPALVVRAAPPNFFSNVEFTVAYRHPSLLSEEERRCLRGLQAALAEVAGAAGASGDSPAEELPGWLVDAGVTLRFEESDAGELLVAEVDELLEEYHRMARALRELSGVGRPVPAT